MQDASVTGDTDQSTGNAKPATASQTIGSTGQECRSDGTGLKPAKNYFMQLKAAEAVDLPTEEELAEMREEWAEIDRAMENCPVKDTHPNVGEDGCPECGYGSP